MSEKLNRRAFLRSAAAMAGAAAVVLPGASSAALPASTGELRGRVYKSFMIGMFREEGLSWAEKFKLFKECGFDGVELNSPGTLPLREILDARDATGVLVSEIVNSTHWTIRLSEPDPKRREMAVNSLRSSLKDAHVLGASSVLLVVGKVTDELEENHEQVWKRSIAEIRKCVPDAAKLGVRIAVENVGNGFCADPKLWAQYIDELAEGSPWIGAHFDIANHIKISPPAEWIHILGRRIVKLHIKDWSQRFADTKSRGLAPLGEGDADWPSVRKALLEINYTGWGAAEGFGGDREFMRDIARRMDSVLGL